MLDARDFGAGQDLIVFFLNAFGQPCGNLFVIDDAGFRNMDTSDAGDVWFEFVDAFLANHFTGDAILLSPFKNAIQGGKLPLVDRHNDFAALIPGNFFGITERFHRAFAFATVDGPEGTRFVVDTGMQHTRIMTGLMLGNLTFFFEDQN